MQTRTFRMKAHGGQCVQMTTASFTRHVDTRLNRVDFQPRVCHRLSECIRQSPNVTQEIPTHVFPFNLSYVQL
jgi:hypothetical protein